MRVPLDEWRAGPTLETPEPTLTSNMELPCPLCP
jgi:hypothetical protein